MAVGVTGDRHGEPLVVRPPIREPVQPSDSAARPDSVLGGCNGGGFRRRYLGFNLRCAIAASRAADEALRPSPHHLAHPDELGSDRCVDGSWRASCLVCRYRPERFGSRAVNAVLVQSDQLRFFNRRFEYFGPRTP